MLKLGYNYLSPEEVNNERNDKTKYIFEFSDDMGTPDELIGIDDPKTLKNHWNEEYSSHGIKVKVLSDIGNCWDATFISDFITFNDLYNWWYAYSDADPTWKFEEFGVEVKEIKEAE